MIKLYYYDKWNPTSGVQETEAARETPQCWFFGERRELKEELFPQWRKYRTPEEAHEAFIEHARYKVNYHESELEKWTGLLAQAAAELYAVLEEAQGKEEGGE